MVGFKTGIKRENDGARGSDLVEGLGKDVLVLVSFSSDGKLSAFGLWHVLEYFHKFIVCGS